MEKTCQDRYGDFRIITSGSPVINTNVSIVMSVFNGESFLRACIANVLRQSFKDFEFIIINDGSSDATKEIIMEMAGCDNRIVMIDQVNMGLTKSLNRGIAVAHGSLIARQDVDDMPDPQRIELQVKRFEKEPQLVLAGTWYNILSDSGFKTLDSPLDDDLVLREKMFEVNPFCHSSCMYRKSAFDAAGGYDDNYRTTQDLELWFRISQHGRIGMVEKPLVERRMERTSLSRSKSAWRQVVNSHKIRMRNRQLSRKRYIFFWIIFVTVYHALLTILPHGAALTISRIRRAIIS